MKKILSEDIKVSAIINSLNEIDVSTLHTCNTIVEEFHTSSNNCKLLDINSILGTENCYEIGVTLCPIDAVESLREDIDVKEDSKIKTIIVDIDNAFTKTIKHNNDCISAMDKIFTIYDNIGEIILENDYDEFTFLTNIRTLLNIVKSKEMCITLDITKQTCDIGKVMERFSLYNKHAIDCFISTLVITDYQLKQIMERYDSCEWIKGLNLNVVKTENSFEVKNLQKVCINHLYLDSNNCKHKISEELIKNIECNALLYNTPIKLNLTMEQENLLDIKTLMKYHKTKLKFMLSVDTTTYLNNKKSILEIDTMDVFGDRDIIKCIHIDNLMEIFNNSKGINFNVMNKYGEFITIVLNNIEYMNFVCTDTLFVSNDSIAVIKEDNYMCIVSNRLKDIDSEIFF